MKVNVRKALDAFIAEQGPTGDFRLPDVELEPDAIRAVLINEIVPADPEDDFYGTNAPPDYLTTALPLFRRAGFDAETVEALTAVGIYFTNAVKVPKEQTTVPKESIEKSLPLLEKELSLFPGLLAVMLMGDVAKKSFNAIARKKTGKSVIPAGSTYKIRKDAFYYGDVRVFPSYIITGRNILIEKSKADMAVEDIARMLKTIGL